MLTYIEYFLEKVIAVHYSSTDFFFKLGIVNYLMIVNTNHESAANLNNHKQRTTYFLLFLFLREEFLEKKAISNLELI